jgi:glucose/arabinose dehydrogenase/cytochrome c553
LLLNTRPFLSILSSSVALMAMSACSQQSTDAPKETSAQCPSGEAETGILLPPGFCATVFADNLGHTRHMVVAEDGTLYVNSWSGRYFRNRAPAPLGGFLIALRDTDGDGKAETIVRFGPKSEDGATGGTGIALLGGGLYVEAGDRIMRYAISAGEAAPMVEPTTILSGMTTKGGHPMHPFTIDQAGNLFVNMGSDSNSCQVENRQAGSPGQTPCVELETRGGIWRYDARKSGQVFSAAARYATGIRNAGGLAVDAEGRLFAVQHGRDQLSQNWADRFTPEQGAETPAEEMMLVTSGADFGWPYCYFDVTQNKRLLAPEYGGDGKVEGQCAAKGKPHVAFPAHMAPMDLLFYRGGQFPAAYRNGAFVAFHGSWNRAPMPQKGYNVYFQPMSEGKPVGKPMIFADGFAGGALNPGQSRFRPAGLALGRDGALYIADDAVGRIWRITYRGKPDQPLVAAPTPRIVERPAGDLPPPPPGFSKKQIALGRRIFHGEERAGTCSGCHGDDARGSSVGPDLASSRWAYGDGSVAAIAKTINEGVLKPRVFNGAMPPKGGADLSPAEIDAVAAYLWAINHSVQ